MYTETIPVRFQGGIHNGTLDALAPFSAHGLRIGGLDPSDYNNWDSLISQYRDPNAQVEVSVDHPDEQSARDIATIARHTIWNGRNLWPGKVIPPERFNQGANHLRAHEGVPQEGPMQVQATTMIAPENYVKRPDDSKEPYEDCRDCGEPISRLSDDGYLSCPNCQWHEKTGSSAAVSGDMSVTSKWTVVALGELQQPGGVGASQDYNPVVDGPNPDGPNFGDNASNGPEQEIALQTWVNLAVDLLNRGQDESAVLAQLAHDGCPDPQAVIERAMKQPEESPVSDSIGQDPFDAPPTQDPLGAGEMQGLSQQPPTMASNHEEDEGDDCPSCRGMGEDDENKLCSDCNGSGKARIVSVGRESKRVRIAGTTMTGTEIDRWEGLWGEGTVKVALDGGGTLDVAPDAVQPIEAESFKHPVSEIQSFIDSMPKVEPSRPHIEARLANLEIVRRAVRANISKVGFSDQVRLQDMDSSAAAEAALLTEILSNHHEDFEVAYAKSSRRFEYNAFNVATPKIASYNGNAREAGAIWATENFDAPVADDTSFTSAAAHFASSIGLTGSQFKDFLAGADEHRKVRTEEFTATEPETIENEGPAEALFV